MLKIELPKPVKFVCGFIYRSQTDYSKTKEILAKKFGKIDFESEKINFNYTGYYYPEMGKPLFRKFISFTQLKNPANFVQIKLFCLKLEKKFAKQNKRSVNIDPGYLCESKLVLATTKDFSHRIYLGKGIFAEVTLFFQNGQFQGFTTTFPDYKTSLYKNIFKQIRDLYTNQLKKSK